MSKALVQKENRMIDQIDQDEEMSDWYNFHSAMHFQEVTRYRQSCVAYWQECYFEDSLVYPNSELTFQDLENWLFWQGLVAASFCLSYYHLCLILDEDEE